LLETRREDSTALRDLIRPGTTRGLDFVVLDELRKRTGVNPDSILKFALSEMLCNALDKDATEINIGVKVEGDFYRLEVRDNGSKKLTLREIKLILDFKNKASSKRGFLTVSRGYLGNALKCIFGYSYALAELRGLTPPDTIVKSGGFQYRITLKPDRVREVIKSEVVTERRKDDGFTTFTVKFPKEDVDHLPYSRPHPPTPSVLKDLIFATSMVNPTRKIIYDMGEYGEMGTLGSKEEAKTIRKVTAVLWYNQKQFQSLYEDFLRARPEMQLKEFVALFRGFTSKKVIREILQKLNSLNHDLRGDGSVQFFPATPIKELSKQIVTALFVIMKESSKPIPKNKRSIKAVLGCVEKESLERLRERRGWKRLKYTMEPGIRVECPYYHSKNPCPNINHV